MLSGAYAVSQWYNSSSYEQKNMRLPAFAEPHFGNFISISRFLYRENEPLHLQSTGKQRLRKIRLQCLPVSMRIS
jgi:hypothetical protein